MMLIILHCAGLAHAGLTRVTKKKSFSMGTMVASPDARSLQRIERLATILDSSIPLGRSGLRIGIDPLIGLIPGFGDALGLFVGVYIIVHSARLGASRIALARMMLNVVVDSAIGFVPLVGDFFDFAFKANQRNLTILRTAELNAAGHTPGERMRAATGLTVATILVVTATLVVAGVYLAVWMFGV